MWIDLDVVINFQQKRDAFNRPSWFKTQVFLNKSFSVNIMMSVNEK